MTLIIYLLNIKSAVTIYFELAAREGGWGVGMSLVLDLKKKYLFKGRVSLSRGDISRESGGTLLQNSNKPTQDL